MLNALRSGSNIYFNYTGQSPCTNYEDTDAAGSIGASGWNVLACNQLAMPISDGINSIFPQKEWNYTAYTKDCQDKYGLTPDYGWALRTFGGMNIKKDFYSYTNIIYSNGELDPWSAGSPKEFINANTPFYLIRGGAHHLDLRLPNDADA